MDSMTGRILHGLPGSGKSAAPTQRWYYGGPAARIQRWRPRRTEAILDPIVQVDSLSRGWYRVLIDGRAAGYVYRSNLDPVSPPR